MNTVLRIFNIAAFIFDVMDITNQSFKMLTVVFAFSVVIDLINEKTR